MLFSHLLAVVFGKRFFPIFLSWNCYRHHNRFTSSCKKEHRELWGAFPHGHICSQRHNQDVGFQIPTHLCVFPLCVCVYSCITREGWCVHCHCPGTEQLQNHKEAGVGLWYSDPYPSYALGPWQPLKPVLLLGSLHGKRITWSHTPCVV